MGLFGALFAGVAGLGSQSNKIGIVSNNISNVNTVGYKQGSAAFNTLVVPSASTGSFSPGGVLGNNRQLVSQQGLIQATTSVTDVAISGGGLFVVNTKADGSGDTLYTRAGSFTQDANGNFRNAAGFFLQGLQVQTPALSVNPGNLSTVNVNQNATGSSVATSLITIASNFNAKQTALPGAGETTVLSGANAFNTAKQVLIPTVGATGNNLQRGDSFDIDTAGSSTNAYSFTYGGFSISRDITSTSTLGDAGFKLVTDPAVGQFAYAAGATNTASAITGINVADKTVAGAPFATGLFSTGALSLGGISITLAGTESLNTIASNLQAQLRTRLGDTTSTVDVTGSPGNYSLTVRDTQINTTTWGGAAIATPSSTFTLVAPVSNPVAGQLTLTVNAANDDFYTVGQKVYVDGLTSAAGSLSAASINGKAYTVVGVNLALNTITLAVPGADGVGGGTAITVTNRTFDFPGNALDASNDSDDFLGTTGTSGFATGATNFAVTVNGSTYTLRYRATPNTANGEFNSLTTLVAAINTSTENNLTATLYNHQIYIGAADANQAVTFSNGDADGATSGSSFSPGINWIQELGLQNIAATTTGVTRFNSLQSLADGVNGVSPTGVIAATVNNPTAIANVKLGLVDPRSTIVFADDAANNGGSVIQALGFVGAAGSDITTNPVTMTSLTGTGYSTGTFTAVYDPNDATKNMSSGAVTPQFSKDITIYDSLGINHTIAMNVLKLSTNTWAVEITAVPITDVITPNDDGQIAYGIVNFGGDGSFSNISVGTLLSPVQINWNPTASGSSPSTIDFRVGTSGQTDGFTQFAGSSNVSVADQNGSPTGQLTGVSIDSNGFVTASFSNGQTQNLYQIPLASVNNPNGLNSVSGNAYKQTLDSGQVSLSLAGTNGTGTLAASALEQSNVDLSTQLTDLIVAQQAYGANTRVLTVTSQLLQELNRIIG